MTEDQTREELYRVHQALPLLADGTRAVPGQRVFLLETTDGGDSWKIKVRRVAAIDSSGLIQCDNATWWIVTTAVRTYASREAAEGARAAMMLPQGGSTG